MTQRRDPVFLTTFSGRPPKEEAMLAIALNRIYTPILRQQIPEITDFFLPMEALSYKLAVISIDKAYPGQAKRAAMAFWSALPQFTYTKFVVVVDKHINVRDPRQVVWAIAARWTRSGIYSPWKTPHSTVLISLASSWGLAAASPLMPPQKSGLKKIMNGVNPSAGQPILNNGFRSGGLSWGSTISAMGKLIRACLATPLIGSSRA